MRGVRERPLDRLGQPRVLGSEARRRVSRPGPRGALAAGASARSSIVDEVGLEVRRRAAQRHVLARRRRARVPRARGFVVGWGVPDEAADAIASPRHGRRQCSGSPSATAGGSPSPSNGLSRSASYRLAVGVGAASQPRPLRWPTMRPRNHSLRRPSRPRRRVRASMAGAALGSACLHVMRARWPVIDLPVPSTPCSVRVPMRSETAAPLLAELRDELAQIVLLSGSPFLNARTESAVGSVEEPPSLGSAFRLRGRRAGAREGVLLQYFILRLAVGVLHAEHDAGSGVRVPRLADVAEVPLALLGPPDLDPAADARVRRGAARARGRRRARAAPAPARAAAPCAVSSRPAVRARLRPDGAARGGRGAGWRRLRFRGAAGWRWLRGRRRGPRAAAGAVRAARGWRAVWRRLGVAEAGPAKPVTRTSGSGKRTVSLWPSSYRTNAWFASSTFSTVPAYSMPSLKRTATRLPGGGGCAVGGTDRRRGGSGAGGCSAAGSGGSAASADASGASSGKLSGF